MNSIKFSNESDYCTSQIVVRIVRRTATSVQFLYSDFDEPNTFVAQLTRSTLAVLIDQVQISRNGHVQHLFKPLLQSVRPA